MIVALVLLWYGAVPVAGALYSRFKWRQFRRRFDELRLRPLLHYAVCRRLQKTGGTFRFIGGFESITDGHTLWVQGEDLTIPVSLAGAQAWLLPMQQGEGIPEDFDPGEEAPERIRWDRISTLTEGARVYVGGELTFQNERWSFVSSRETPLLVIIYDCPDRVLTPVVIRAGRHRNEYWNTATPYALIAGALCQIYIAVSFLNRPAFRLTVIAALVALFIPVMPMIPPGLLFTVLYRRLAWQARILRAYRDLSRLPLRYLAPGENSCRLPDGEIYGGIPYQKLPDAAREGKVPLLIPEQLKEGKHSSWYICGALQAGQTLPTEPADPFAVYGILPGKPEQLSHRYALIAYTLEAAAWLALLAGIALNIFFIRMILILL
ncbi:hypothetical protein AGMMS50293_19220 [Spirochaetia bacterium]|nr:hypothetical protein AGMMS50293_19220 [Spirochaetia bacterium]